MVTLRDLHRYQTNRSVVQLEDGRIGKIVRVDTTFPENHTVVSVYTLGDMGSSAEESASTPANDADEQSESRKGPGITRVNLDRIVGLAKVPA